MPEEESNAEAEKRQQERRDRATAISVIAIIASGILTFAAQDALFPPSRRRASRGSACIANLKCIEGAKATWALENNIRSNGVPADKDLFGATVYMREKPVCPAGGVYTLGAVNQKARCSIAGHTI